ncbi:MAG: hypothetical protein IJU52_07015 [Clostridia bacterium]|nr:hypothetical protein [Clostridia bacterium]
MKFHEDLFELLPKLSLAFGPTGCEKRVLDLIKTGLDGVCDCTFDAVGNLICRLPGEKGTSYAFISGVDEVGFMITKIDDKGYLRVESTSSGDPACFLGKKMVAGGDAQLFEGVGAAKVLHTLKGNERTDAPEFERLFIDLGFEKKEELENKIEVGDFAAFKGDYFEMPHDHIVGKALECRANCAILVTLLKLASKLKKEERNDLTVIFAVKEKIGFSGAVTALHRLAPDRAVLLGFEPSCDLDEKDADRKGALLGKGPVLPLKDGRALYYDDPVFFERAKNACGSQFTQILDGSQTLSSSRAHLVLAGVPMISLRLPCHNPETPYVIVNKTDIERTLSKVWSLAVFADDDGRR